MTTENTNYKRVPVNAGQEFMVAVDGVVQAKGTPTFDCELSIYAKHRGESKIIWN